MLLMEVLKCQKIVEFPKISINMKNIQTYFKSQTAIYPKEIIQPALYKSFLRFGINIFKRRFTGI